MMDCQDPTLWGGLKPTTGLRPEGLSYIGGLGLGEAVHGEEFLPAGFIEADALPSGENNPAFAAAHVPPTRIF